MSAPFSWSLTPPTHATRRVDPAGVVYIVSDLHLGDGSPTDIFMAKDRPLLEFLDRVEQEGATLLVAGDAIDFSQAWSLTRILRAHGRILGALSRLANQGRMIYILGNHDHDLRLYDEVLNIPVVSRVEIGQHTLVTHGFEYDPVIGPDLHRSEQRTFVHHLLERAVGSWIRLPLQRFYTWPNRLAFWFFHKAVLFGRWRLALWARLTGDHTPLERTNAEIAYWVLGELGDPGSLFRPATAALDQSPYRALICGHSHLPGVLRLPSGRVFANSGSWTFTTSSYLRVDAARLPEADAIECRDYLTGKVYGDRLHRPLLAGEPYQVDFLDWWAHHYRGWLRYDFERPVRPDARPPDVAF